MVANRAMQTATVITYGGQSAYGEDLYEQQSERTTEMALSLYNHTETDDIRYQDCEYVGLTKDKDITDKDTVQICGTNYKVLFVNNAGRLSQVFMK